MPYLLRNASLAILDPPKVESVDVRIAGGIIAGRGSALAQREDDEVIDIGGKLVMPGMVCAHTHLYSTLARGMPAPARAPSSFREILELVWWKLDRALDEESIYWSALAGAAEAARAGTTCLYDHHASPACIPGSLDIIREALERIGLRAVLCYEVTDRGTRRERDAAIQANEHLLRRADREPESLIRGMVGAHASFTLSDRSLESCAGLMRRYGAGLHIHAAEDRCDIEETRRLHGVGIVDRLAANGALNARTILAHGTHLKDPEIEVARRAGVWFAHNPRSNMNNRVGHAPVARFGDRLVLGTDGIGADMFEEARFAFFRGREAHLTLEAGHWLRVLATNQRMASSQFGVDLFSLEVGSAADLIVLDYPSPTPLTSENLAWHFVFGMTSASVDSVMAAGRFLVRERQPLFDASEICEGARRAGEKLWARIQEV